MEQRKARILYILILAGAMSVLIFGKLFYVQVLASEKYSDESLNNRLQNVEVTPNRGIIYDCNNEAMAVSVEKISVYIKLLDEMKLEFRNIGQAQEQLIKKRNSPYT